MNKIIPFTKVISLKERFDEITKITLDDTLKLDDPYTIKGDLIIRGCYKIEEKEEDFSYPIPVEIAIDSKYDTEKCSITIDDFYYEIINEQNIRVKIDIALDDLYYKEEPAKKEELVLEDNRNLEELFEEIEVPKKEIVNKEIENTMLKKEEVNEIARENKEIGDSVQDLFKEVSEEKEYSIYRVYVFKENETIEYIMDKYKVTREELGAFNDLENLRPGMKLIIPSTDE